MRIRAILVNVDPVPSIGEAFSAVHRIPVLDLVPDPDPVRCRLDSPNVTCTVR